LHRSRLCALVVVLVSSACSHPLSTRGAPDQQAELRQRRQALDALIKEQWEYFLRTSPEVASIIGDKRYNDRLSEFSQAAIDRDRAETAAFLRRFEALDAAGLSDQETLNRELMIRALRLDVEEARFKTWEMPVLQNSGPHLDLPQFVALFSFQTVKDHDDYLARLHQIPRLLGETIIQMRNGMRDGLMPPRFLLEKVVRQCETIAATPVKESPFARPLASLPAAFSERDRQRLNEAITAAIRDEVAPAYRKLAAFVRDEYAPRGRTEVGLWSLPDGAARYALRVRISTTTDMTPDQIHALGLGEVERIERLMLTTARKLGHPDLASLSRAMVTNAALHPRSRQEIVDRYSKVTDQMYGKLPQLFGRLPRGKVIVMPVEEFREKEAPAAAYDQGTPDGSRPGHIMVNTGDFAHRLTVGIETTALHEGVPGHHLQIALAQELADLPPFRQQGNYTAYAEGWALYSERLGEEVGFYQDPYSYYGHLQDEMLRAIRLVVDTGLHQKRWTRQQVVDFFHAHSTIEEVDVQSETDRYIAWPGQALGYKVGQLKILELRDYARQQLGAAFDLRRFHDEVLGAGALPLDLLERRIKGWVAQQKTPS
jgi:uncharacterized protein (DUF885 family)